MTHIMHVNNLNLGVKLEFLCPQDVHRFVTIHESIFVHNDSGYLKLRCWKVQQAHWEPRISASVQITDLETLRKFIVMR